MLQKILDVISAFMKYIAAVIVGVIITINFAAVIMRYSFNSPIIWCEEVSLILFVWFVFLALGPVTRKHGGVSLDFFIDLLPLKVRNIVQLVVQLVSILVYIIIIIFTFNLINVSQYRFTPILQIPYKYIYFPIIIGMGFSALFLCEKCYKYIRCMIRKDQEVAGQC